MSGSPVHIVIVDDEVLQLDYMENLIREAANDMNLQVKLSRFESGESFLFALEDHPEWDLAFLDIEMKRINGIEVARELHEKNPEMRLIFATAYAEYAVESYQVQALDYLLKPITSEKIKRAMARFLDDQPEVPTYILLQIAGESVRINLDEILYVEANQGELEIVTTSENYLMRQSLGKLRQELDERFVLPHRSYLVNLGQISRLLSQEIHLTNGQVIPLSRRRSKDIQKAFIAYHKGAHD